MLRKVLVQVSQSLYDMFPYWESYDFFVESKKDVETRQKMKANFMAIYAMMMQDPSTKEYEKVLWNVQLICTIDSQKKKQEAFVIPTPDELNAREYVKYINEDMMDKARVESMSEDHYTYLYVYESARDTDIEQYILKIKKESDYTTAGTMTNGSREWISEQVETQVLQTNWFRTLWLNELQH